MADLTENFKWLAIQYQNTNVQDLLIEISQIQQTYQKEVLDEFLSKLDIDTADGIWLDYLGYRLGILARPGIPNQGDYFGFDGTQGVGGQTFNNGPFIPTSLDKIPLDDDNFRLYLKVKARQLVAAYPITIGNITLDNSTTCTPENIRDILLIIFEKVEVIDNQDMTMDVNISTSMNLLLAQTFIDNGVITKPASVQINTTLIPI